MSIEVSSLSRSYGEQKALDAISFRVAKGEIVGFLGPNGAGKSTTMKILTGYLKPDSGTAKVDGISVTEDPMAVKRLTGYLPEANPLYYDMYVKEYLGFVADIHRIPEKKRAISEAIEQVKLTLEQKKKIGQLSKGYKQRVGLAAALVHKPGVLILDEPTTGLDPNQIVEIRDVIRAYGRSNTVLFSSHILQEIEAVCDRVVIINKGRIVADDSVAHLRARQATALVRVSFDIAPAPASIPALEALGAVRRGSDTVWELSGGDHDALKKQLLALSLQNNWNIVSLQSETQSLEDIFRILTNSPDHEQNS